MTTAIQSELSQVSPEARDFMAQKLTVIQGRCDLIKTSSRSAVRNDARIIHEAAEAIAEAFGMPGSKAKIRAAVAAYRSKQEERTGE